MTKPRNDKSDARFAEDSRYRGQMRVRSRRARRREALLQDWYGEDYYAEEVEARQPPGRPLGELLAEVLREMDTGPRTLLRDLVDRWPEIVGEQVARYTAPRSIQEHVLMIEVSSPVWMYRLNPMRGEILEQCRRATGDRIRFVRLVPGGATPSQPNRNPGGRTP